ncbi:hypothetical protein H4W19_02295 [Pseudoxanthomonas mexicana]|uniref:Uncharacterized protein n=1 Tax=Pseudoxanthomonas mexicana TaxID=128785 RepID=A0ABX6RC88_PSEMX|nr:hypothetical protein [Pseudoxanthomonas mexicana]QND80651.1 hypothetical protein H4W19_02295 [Pseudoxanthomonas mexicana]
MVLLLVLAQGCFIYAIQHGAGSAFADSWAGFDVVQSGYSHFVFRTIKGWWSLPMLCLCLAAVAAKSGRTRHAALALTVSIVGIVALLAAAYAPGLFISV